MGARDPRAESGSPSTPPPLGPRPLGALADLAELLAGESPRSRRFLGGVIVGALVGAAVAGSALLRAGRRRGGDPGGTAS